MENNIDAGQNV